MLRAFLSYLKRGEMVIPGADLDLTAVLVTLLFANLGSTFASTAAVNTNKLKINTTDIERTFINNKISIKNKD